MFKERVKSIICTVIIIFTSSGLLFADESNKENIDEGNRKIDVFGARLPVSDLLDEDTKTAHESMNEKISEWTCPGGEIPFRSKKAILVARRCSERDHLPVLAKLRKNYHVDIQSLIFGDVYTEAITPSEGIAQKNKGRVLINLHGGAFAIHGRVGGQLESIVVAATGHIKVIAVDYRMYPEHVFPAATDDILVVYKELLKSYRPENIGIYGCSAGAALTAQTLVRLQREGIPAPGAVGMLCGAAIMDGGGDSSEMLSLINGKVELGETGSYFMNEDLDNPLISPGKYPDILQHFPPSLLVSSTRDFALSGVVVTHSQLVKLGVEAELHIYEGLGHSRFLNPDVPEFVEVHKVIVKFFDKYLGKGEEQS